jgi:hypothetical protein
MRASSRSSCCDIAVYGLPTLAACAAALLPGSPARADRIPNPLNDRFQVTLGTFFLTSEPIVQLNGETEPGDRVHWDRAFGRMDADRFRLESHWRFADRHKIRAIAFSLSRERSEVLDESIDWGGETYPVHAEVRAEFSFEILELAYEYAFWRRKNYELGASIGFHYTALDASLEALAEASSGTLTEDLDDAAAVNVPLPVIGFSGTWSLSHNFWLDASAQFFALSIDEYDGYLQSYRASLTWQPRSWLGIGIGYSLFSTEVDVANDDLDGALDWTYDGPMVFYRASF